MGSGMEVILNMLERRVPNDGRRSWGLAPNELDRDAAREDATEEGVDSPGDKLGVATPEEIGELICEPGP